MTDPVKSWFAKRRLGLFLHFGLYAIEGWHEQDQMRRRIPAAQYVQLASRFNPTEFDANRILDLAESVGMEYVCLTTKHHDGFCLWDTQQTDFNVMQTPYGKDIVRQLADACHARNFPLGLYYSVADWHHPNYPNLGRHHELPEPKPGDAPDWDKYIDYLRAQVRELCTNYGPVRHFFWDINVPEHQDSSINQMLRSLQPSIVINDRGFDAGDFGTPERDYSEAQTRRQTRFARPTEACNSVGSQSWGYRRDEDYYSTGYLTQCIDEMMAKGAHYLLNVGPDATGRMPDIATQILTEVGNWYRRVREAFDDTTPCSDLTTNPRVWLTRRDNTLYVHLKNPPTADAVTLPPLAALPSRAQLLNTGDELPCSTDVLPVHWRNNTRVLQIKNIPRHALAMDEPLVIRLDFQDGLPETATEPIKEFQG
jgi:alpha-L-fucosidase